MLAVVNTHVVNGNDVRVLEERRSRDLAPEPLNDLFARELPGQNHLQSDDAPETELPRAIHHAHPAAGDLFEQFVIAEATNRLLVGRGASGITCRLGRSGGGGKFGAKTFERRG
jgi:hypothetical protein